ncbi:hypothetical protein AQUCO_09300019v1 [Aquilegia coerulea]|uniref:Fibronectin type III-like domain-containing protein n=1 Tax=Aquilegia coerulea TaxID=218851 RepID=A0A2G5C582_AQUCA|nr:hypothetical protein AQUCO_09300019v1 [Aquilegia coerulea]
MDFDPKRLHFCDKTLSYQVRAKDLVDRLTLEEKIAQLGDKAPGVPRLHIPPYIWRSDPAFGIKFNDTIHAVTSFPAVLLTTASFNETLWKAIGETVSDEVRAMHNFGIAGLTYWDPNVNVATDPRWGRIQETAGEDPFVVGRYGLNYVRGLQDVQGHINYPDPNARPLKVAATCKYYTAYGMENDPTKKIDKYHFDAQVTVRDMMETFNYPFELVNGIPSCADPNLLNGTVRELWGLHGYIVDDCDWVLSMILVPQKFLNDTPADAIAQAYKAGVDLDCRGDYTPKYIMEAVNQGKLSEVTIDKALINLYVVLMRLGWFDGSPGIYNHLGRFDIHKGANLDLAQEAARQGIVLLHNDRDILPLNWSNRPTIALVGPHANATTALLGNSRLKNDNNVFRYLRPLTMLQGYANVKYAPGCFDVNCQDTSGFQAAVDATEGTEATLLFVGLDSSVEDETSDRQNLYLPSNQQKLINTILESPKSSPLVVVILSGGGIDISDWNWRVAAVVWAGYPGADGGVAIIDVLFGKKNPAGRLPVTWYKGDYTNKLPMTSMQLRPNPDLGYPGRTYKFSADKDVLYPFGYGQSYSEFNYTILAPKFVLIERPELPKCRQITFSDGTVAPDCPAILVTDSICNKVVKITVVVTNAGKRDGAHVVLLYSKLPSNIGGTLPNKRLVGFQRVFITSGEALEVGFDLNVCKSFSFVSEDAYELLPVGDHSIVVGQDLSTDTAIINQDVSAKMSIMFQMGTVNQQKL